MRRGHRWEQTVADAVHVITGLYVVGEQAGVEHDTNPMWRYTTDGFLAYSPEATTDQVHGVYECKTTGLGVHHNWERNPAPGAVGATRIRSDSRSDSGRHD